MHFHDSGGVFMHITKKHISFLLDISSNSNDGINVNQSFFGLNTIAKWPAKAMLTRAIIRSNNVVLGGILGER